ncbi:MAG: hypothetical protein MJ117_10145, partial [Lachnospiraceae bacterium]|nr:hypothetical protein [Lachnospiraceae bacterium]
MNRKIYDKSLFSFRRRSAIFFERTFLSGLLLTGLLLVGGCITSPLTVYADAEHSAYARSGETSTSKEVMKYGMTPISGEYVKDGSWEIQVVSSSKFFRIHSCELLVKDHKMTAKLTMETYSYPLLCMATAEDAAAAPAEDYIAYEDIDDWAVFTVPVKGLNMPIDCAAFSKKKSKWYNRQILFDASTLNPEALDGIQLPDYDLIEGALEKAGIDPENPDGQDGNQEGMSDSAGKSSAGTQGDMAGSSSTDAEGNTVASQG